MNGKYVPPAQPPRQPDIYEQADQSMQDFVAQAEPIQRSKRRGKKLFIAAAVLLFCTVCAGAVYVVINQQRDGSGQPAASSAVEEPQPSQSSSVEELTENYESSEFRLSFEHPGSWTITESPGSGLLTAKSGPVKVPDETNAVQDAQIVLTIRRKGMELTEFADGNAVAVIDSQKINYAKPSSVQRGSTYVSFLGFAGSSEEGLDGVYITGDTGYQVGQAIPKADFVPVDPIISVTFAKCTTADCKGNINPPMSISVAGWQGTPVLQRVIDILRSLVIN